MDSIAYARVRENLAAIMDRVCHSHAPVVVTRPKGQAVVMMSLEDYNAIQEMTHLLRSLAHAARRRSSFGRPGPGEGDASASDEPWNAPCPPDDDCPAGSPFLAGHSEEN